VCAKKFLVYIDSYAINDTPYDLQFMYSNKKKKKKERKEILFPGQIMGDDMEAQMTHILFEKKICFIGDIDNLVLSL